MSYIEELQKIEKQHGGVLRPEDVVEFASDPNTELHDKFTWDDTSAAQSYRLWEARKLIRVAVKTLPQAKSETRVYVSLQSDRQTSGGGYRKVEDVMSDPGRRAEFLLQAHREMERFISKYRELEELADVFAAMKKAKRTPSRRGVSRQARRGTARRDGAGQGVARTGAA